MKSLSLGIVALIFTASPAKADLTGFSAIAGRTVSTAPGKSFVVAGQFSGTVDFGNGPLVSAGGTDGFVVKFAPSGAALWSRRFGGPGNESVSAACQDSAGSVYAVSSDVKLYKFDASGDPQSTNSIGSANLVIADMAASGTNLFIGGSYSGFIGSVGGIAVGSTYGGIDSFLAKLSAIDGSALWAECLAASSDNWINALALSPNGTISAVGQSLGAIDPGNFTGVLPFPLPPTALRPPSGVYLGFLGQYDQNGSLAGQLGLIGSSGCLAMVVAVDSAGAVFVGGTFKGNLNIGVGAMTAANFDLFLAKLAGNRACLWSRSMSGGTTKTITSIATDSLDNAAVSGYFNQSVDLGQGPITIPPGVQDGFEAVYAGNASGLQPPNLVWSKVLTSSGTAWPYRIAFDRNGSYKATGFFINSIGLDGTVLTNANSSTMFLSSVPALQPPVIAIMP